MTKNKYRKWDRFNLTFSIHNYNPNLDRVHQIEVVDWAFGIWAAVTRFEFEKLADGMPADIELYWQKGIGDVGCANPPPGSAGQKPDDGNAFFSLDHEWTFDFKKESGAPYDFYTLCAHELGHSLGLGQQLLTQNALMGNHWGVSFRHTTENDVNCYKGLYERDASPEDQCAYFLEENPMCCTSC